MYFGCCLSGAHWWLTLQLIVLTRGGNTVIIGLYSQVFCDNRQEIVRAIAKENHREGEEAVNEGTAGRTTAGIFTLFTGYTSAV